jgi:hypothetical protein
MISTHGGMRRILKRRVGAGDGYLTYIRQAVESGTYRTTEEIDEMLRARAAVYGLSAVDMNQPDFEQDDGSGITDLKSVMGRFRQDIHRGSSVVDYPKEYLILRQHPPFPEPARTPAKAMRRLQRQRQDRAQAETKPLVQHYMNRQQNQQQAGSNDVTSKSKKTSADYSSEAYYRRLLGVAAPPLTTMLGQRTAAVQKAYAAAMFHYQLERSSSVQLSPVEISQKVDELLKQAHEEQVETCQAVADQVQQWKKQRAQEKEQQQKQKQQDADQKETTQSNKTGATRRQQTTVSTSTTNTLTSSSSASAATTVTTSSSTMNNNILGNDPRKVHGMLRWSKRLQAVPYRQWTVGASTALDHWIARQVLKMEDYTWQSLLEGGGGQVDDKNGDLIQFGRQIVAVREALFPETSIAFDESSSSWQEEEEDDDEYNNKSKDADSDKSKKHSVELKIEELLASLGSMSSSSSSSSSPPKDIGDTSFLGMAKSQAAEKYKVTDSSNNVLVVWTHKLQEWRRRCLEAAKPLFQDWSLEKKNEFRAFVREYASIASASAYGSMSSSRVLLDKRDHEDDALLQVLLEHPPVNEPESSAFWNALQTKEEATKLLATLRATTRNGEDNDKEDKDSSPGVNNGKNNATSAAALALVEFFIGPPSMFLNDDVLSQSEQLDRLLNLGALRPLLDEYISEEERIDFWKRHGDTVFASVPLEHLIEVSDETDIGGGDGSGSGIITGHDLQGTALSRDLNLALSPQSRFLLQTIAFREDASSLVQAWNEHKSSRARYEEELFQTGRLGLRYPKKADRDKAEESDDDDDDDKMSRNKRQPWY